MSLRNAALCRGSDKSSIEALAESKPLLLVLLRHSGCPLCREHLVVTEGMLADVPEGSCRVVGICQGEGDEALALEQDLALSFPVYANPDASLYRELAMPRGSWWQVTLGPMLRQPIKALRRMREVRRPGRDVKQLGGVVLLSAELEVLYRYAQRDSGDLPGDDDVLAAIYRHCQQDA